ncbi:ATP-binding cassette domain-containing protein [Demequina sp. B12]|uniref:ABC transporter ATP-binding protein n=1 Tax=Demequina sp. B12 TaxID=2992757 RepID=UPI003158D21D
MDHGGITFSHVRKEYPDGTVAVADLTLDAVPGEILCLVGPSGCGKSTTLRMVNRLVEPSGGVITVDGQDIMEVPAVELRRSIGYVIQHVGLLPHKTVAANVATVPSLMKWPQAQIRDRVEELLTLVGLDPDVHGSRYPHELSGGQRQRIGVARALAVKPPVMLMDEPFGAVDPQGRRRLQQEFMTLQRDLGLTVVMVTHDMREAVLMADRIAVLSTGGVLEQWGTPEEVTQAPANDFVADFLADFA